MVVATEMVRGCRLHPKDPLRVNRVLVCLDVVNTCTLCQYNVCEYTVITHLIGSYCKIFPEGVARGKYFYNMTQSDVL